MPSIDIRANPTDASSSNTALRMASVTSERSTAAPAGVRRWGAAGAGASELVMS